MRIYPVGRRGRPTLQVSVTVPIQASARSWLEKVLHRFLCQYLFKPQHLCATGTYVSTYSGLSLFVLQVPVPNLILASASLCYRYLCQYLFIPQLLFSTGTCANTHSGLSLSLLQIPAQYIFKLQVPVPEPNLASASLCNRYLCTYSSLSLTVLQVPVPVPFQTSASFQYRYLRHSGRSLSLLQVPAQYLFKPCPTGTCART